MYLVVGIGNPGEQYEVTRHNLGFMVLDEFCRKARGTDFNLEKKFKAEICKIGNNLILVKPQTYVNLSGMAVSSLKNFYKIPSENIILIHDDLDIPLGKMKLRLGGSGAGHHGVESVIKSLGTDQFWRYRLGIGNLDSLQGEHKVANFNAEHFVVEPFLPSERSKVKSMIKRIIKSMEVFIDKGPMTAQNAI